MALNIIWVGFFLIGFAAAFYQWAFQGNQEIFRTMVEAIFKSAGDGFTISLNLVAILSLFLGFMKIGEKAGAIHFLSRIVSPFFSRLFPEVPKSHPAVGHMMMNFSANLLGLDNAATPFGLKAMESLQELNPDKERASNAQIMFLALHASGLTLIPITIIATRASFNPPATNPTDIFLPCMIVSFVATMTALIIVSVRQRINLINPVMLGWIGSISVLIGVFVWYLTTLSQAGLQSFSSVLSSGLILLIFLLFLLGGWRKKINLFDAFIEGAKGGFEVAIRIIPYLIAMLVAISVFRTSGVFDFLLSGIAAFFGFLGFNTDFVPALPTALMRPLSGSGARGLMIESMRNYGPDSFVARLSGIMQGSSDTTFYVVALYFGSISVKNSRYSIPVMLLADLVGVTTAILLAYLFFH